MNDLLNYLDSAVNALNVATCNENLPVVMNINFNARLFDNFVDNLAARADNFANFIDGNFHSADAWSIRRQIGRRFADNFKHLAQNKTSAAFSLRECIAQNFSRNARDFNIHLNRRDAFGSARDFEVHIAERVFHTLNIG